MKLVWQSKLVLLLVLPFAAAGVVLQSHFCAENLPQVAIWTLGLSLVFGVVVFRLRAATPAAAFTGAAITASLMFSTATFPYQPWRTALVPVLAVFLLSFVATRLGREQERAAGHGGTAAGANCGAGCGQFGCGGDCLQRICPILAGRFRLVFARRPSAHAPFCRGTGGAG